MDPRKDDPMDVPMDVRVSVLMGASAMTSMHGDDYGTSSKAHDDDDQRGIHWNIHEGIRKDVIRLAWLPLP